MKDHNLPREEANKRHWDNIVRNFPLSDNCLVLTLKGTSVGHEKNMKDLANAINRMGICKGVLVGSVESFDHIRVLDEGKMAEAGWVRQERITINLASSVIFTRFKINIRLGLIRAWNRIKEKFQKKEKPLPVNIPKEIPEAGK
jgi:hypothetical protein